MRAPLPRRTLALITVAVIGLGGTLAACGKNEAAPSPSAVKTPATATATAVVSAKPSAATKTAPPAVETSVWPLTGVPGELVERPAVAYKIENSPEARPQTGLEFADVVWETIVEGGISRYVAVYHSQMPDEVGPVRSIRPMDGPITCPTHGLLAFSGGKTHFINVALGCGVQTLSMDFGAGGFYRVSGKAAPHNVYSKPADMLEQADEEHQKSPQQEFEFATNLEKATVTTSGQAATSVAMTMSGGSHPNWEWDASGKWLRSEGSNPAMAASGERLSAVNVVVMKVDVTYAEGHDAAGNPIPESWVVGEGEGLVLTGGKALEIDWSKADRDKPLVLKTKDGNLVKLAPGNTWVEVMPKSQGAWTINA
ncbi:MAG: DUF3048 domain-containing protein [Bifidobacteriaceae bacterium]|jgi:hypothetical protein|nr:DUF3048 domain-containing protein [Bifidobacteriaceae bacterium]